MEFGLADGTRTRAELEKELAILKPYLTIVVECSTDRPNGRSVYAREKRIRSRAVLKLPDGSEVKPLAEVPQSLLDTVRAIRAGMISSGDPGMHILIFPNKDKNGERLIEASDKDKLTLVLRADNNYREATFVWNTPFDALMSVPPCSKCGGKSMAKWYYCSWCGQKLPEIERAEPEKDPELSTTADYTLMPR